jgi:restriction endonuclease-like protein
VDVSLRASHFAADLRRELCERNAEFARVNGLAHVPSYGAVPVTVYAPQDDGKQHGNFYPASYRAILKRSDWALRLNKIHSQQRAALPRVDRRWRELDSCTSSDALLMNIFCCPGVCGSRNLAGMLGTETTDAPEFGYRARVPVKNGASTRERFDRTEADMKLGALLVESKLTESDFQTAPPRLVESYRDLDEVFDAGMVPRSGDLYVSYQLIRNVLAAHSGGLSFCVMLDERRPDLLEEWHSIMRCVCLTDLRTRCKVLTWQELSTTLPSRLRKFLHAKYGIIHPNSLA